MVSQVGWTQTSKPCSQSLTLVSQSLSGSLSLTCSSTVATGNDCPRRELVGVDPGGDEAGGQHNELGHCHSFIATLPQTVLHSSDQVCQLHGWFAPVKKFVLSEVSAGFACNSHRRNWTGALTACQLACAIYMQIVHRGHRLLLRSTCIRLG